MPQAPAAGNQQAISPAAARQSGPAAGCETRQQLEHLLKEGLEAVLLPHIAQELKVGFFRLLARLCRIMAGCAGMLLPHTVGQL